MLWAGACAWSSPTLVLVEIGSILGSAAVANLCDFRRGSTLGGGGRSNLGGGTLLYLCGSTLEGDAGLWDGGYAGGIGVWYYCPSMPCISCVINLGDFRGAGLLVDCIGGRGGAVWLKISWRRSNA